MPSDRFTLRPALKSDFPAIRRLIWQVNINPTGLNWRRFWVVVDENDRLIGCGQVKTHQGGIKELASIAIVPERRGEGISRQVIEQLIAQHPGLLYLTCRSELGAFYQRFGFRPLEFQEMPFYYRRLVQVVRILRHTGLMPGEMLVMGRTVEQTAA